MSVIKFGTDGWRAIIADHFTFNNVNMLSQAVAKWLLRSKKAENGVVIGYDARFLSREFAEHAASVYAEMGLPVRLSDRLLPTPAISHAAQQYDAFGIVITASHNPPEYNGYKIKSPFGGSAIPDQIMGIENELASVCKPVTVQPFQQSVKIGLIREMNLLDGYLKSIRKNIDLEAIRNSGLKVAHDPMYGAGSGILKQLLGEEFVKEIHGERNPLFGGTAPEPVEQKLSELCKITKESCGIGIANDGDADRITMVDENGDFVSSHKILSLLVEYLHNQKGLKGTVVKTFSTTDMIDKQAEKYGLPLIVTPIGFKYIAELMVDKDVLTGGEESGGLAAKGHLPERDGIYIGLLIIEMMVRSGKALSELVAGLFDEYGPHYYHRKDLLTDDSKKHAMIGYCKAKKLKKIQEKPVVKWDFKDGIKHHLDDGSWVLVRPSGTEPVLRIYAESNDPVKVQKLVEEVAAVTDMPVIFD
jgi:phosphomannomutase